MWPLRLAEPPYITVQLQLHVHTEYTSTYLTRYEAIRIVMGRRVGEGLLSDNFVIRQPDVECRAWGLAV